MSNTDPKPGLSIIIVSHNTRDYLDQCLQSVFAQRIDYPHEVIVVENYCFDGVGPMVLTKYPKARYQENRIPLGLARNNNRGLTEAAGEFLLFSNPDIIFPQGSINRMVGFLVTHPQVDIAGPCLVYPDGTPQYSCRRFPNITEFLCRRTFLRVFLGSSFPARRHLMLDQRIDSPLAVDWVLGACYLVRRSAMERIGAFDEGFFLYGEETDLCYRLWRSGGEVYYLPEVKVTHFEHGERQRRFLSRRTYHRYRSAMRFWFKHCFHREGGKKTTETGHV